jgi:Protein of unknown function (DUF2442)
MDYPKDEIEAANKRAAARLAKTPTAIRARYNRRIGCLIIDLSTGFSIAFKPHKAQGLEDAKPEQLTKIEISPSGLSIHFPDLDADLYLPGLLEGVFGSRKWMASQLGKIGGRSGSTAKAAASRSNGKLGGRPKKNPQLLEASQRLDYMTEKIETIKSIIKKELTKASGQDFSKGLRIFLKHNNGQSLQISYRGFKPDLDKHIIKSLKAHGYQWYASGVTNNTNVREHCFDWPGQQPITQPEVAISG